MKTYPRRVTQFHISRYLTSYNTFYSTNYVELLLLYIYIYKISLCVIASTQYQYLHGSNFFVRKSFQAIEMNYSRLFLRISAVLLTFFLIAHELFLLYRKEAVKYA
jgi:hypothetical protein